MTDFDDKLNRLASDQVHLANQLAQLAKEQVQLAREQIQLTGVVEVLRQRVDSDANSHEKALAANEKALDRILESLDELAKRLRVEEKAGAEIAKAAAVNQRYLALIGAGLIFVGSTFVSLLVWGLNRLFPT